MKLLYLLKHYKILYTLYPNLLIFQHYCHICFIILSSLPPSQNLTTILQFFLLIWEQVANIMGLQHVFPKNKEILLHKYSIINKFQKFNTDKLI